jgi:uncharacterized protein YjbJ (UPF0337 family)
MKHRDLDSAGSPTVSAEVARILPQSDHLRHSFSKLAGTALALRIRGGRIVIEDLFKGQWTQLKGRIRTQWGKLTDDEVDQMRGERERLIGKLQEHYGLTREEAEGELERWLEDQDLSGDNFEFRVGD